MGRDKDNPPDDLPVHLNPGTDPLRQGGMTVGLAPNAKAPGGSRVLHFVGLTELLLAIALILDPLTRFVSRGDLRESVAKRHGLVLVEEVPAIPWKDGEGTTHYVWVDYACETVWGRLRLVEGGSLLPGERGLDNIRRAADALANYAERAGYEYAFGTRSCLSRRFTIGALYPYLATFSYRGPRSLVAEVRRLGVAEPWTLQDRRQQLAPSVGPERALAAALCAVGEEHLAGHLAFPLHKQRLTLASQLQFLPDAAPPLPLPLKLFTSIPDDVSSLTGDETVPEWVERTGEFRPELIPDPDERQRVQLCLAAAEEVDAHRLDAKAAAIEYQLERRIGVGPHRYAEMYQTYTTEVGWLAFRRYGSRIPKASQLHPDLQAFINSFARMHKGATGRDIRRDPAYRDLASKVATSVAEAVEGGLMTPGQRTRALGSAWQIAHCLELAQNDPVVRRLNQGRRPRRQVHSSFGKSWLENQAYAVLELDEDVANFMVQLGRGESFAARPHRAFLVDVVIHLPVAMVFCEGAIRAADVKRLLLRSIENRGYLVGDGGQHLPWPAHGISLIYRTDRGRMVWNNSIFDLCVDLGTIIEAAPARSPWRKPDVEQAIGEFQDSFDRLMPSYVGASPTERGAKDAERIAIQHGLTLDTAEALANDHLVNAWLNVRHESLDGSPLEALRASDRMYGRRDFTEHPFWLRVLLGNHVGSARVTNNGIWYLHRRYTDPPEVDAADLHVPDELRLPPEFDRGRVIEGGTRGTIERVSNDDDLRYLDIFQRGEYRGRVFSTFFMEWGTGRPVSLYEYRLWQAHEAEARATAADEADAAAARTKEHVPPKDARRAARERARLKRSADSAHETAPSPAPLAEAPRPGRRTPPAPRGSIKFAPAHIPGEPA